MKLMLIDPPVNSFTGFKKRGFPLGLCSLGSVIRDNTGLSVDVMDADKIIDFDENVNFTDQAKCFERYLTCINDPKHNVWQQIRKLIFEKKPSVIGISTMTIQYASALKLAQLVKEIDSKCLVIMGGAHASVMPDLMMQWPYVDLVVKGEGEDALLEIIKRKEAGNNLFQDIPGVIGRDFITKVHDQPCEIKDLNALPIPDRSLLMNVEKYSSEDMGLIMTSRGCPYKCAYCSNYTRKVRSRSIENVIKEICIVQSQYNTKQFLIKDDSFTVNKKRVAEFCDEIQKRKLKLNWECTTRLDLIDDDLIKKMKTSGCNRVAVGIESGDEEVLNMINKKMDKNDIRKGVEVLKKNKMYWTGYFLIGMPMESREAIKKTVEFMQELNPPYASVGVYKPYPGTKLYDKALELGIVDPDVSNDYFLKNNPVNYFLKDPLHRSIYICGAELDKIVFSVQGVFESHNKKIINLYRRAASRIYLYSKDYSIFIRDLMIGFRWILKT